jgi:hypothetical protein
MDVSISLALLWYQNQQYYYTAPMKYDVILITHYSQPAEQRKKLTSFEKSYSVLLNDTI